MSSANPAIKTQEYELLARIMRDEGGVVSRVARKLGLTRQSLHRRLDKWPELRGEAVVTQACVPPVGLNWKPKLNPAEDADDTDGFDKSRSVGVQGFPLRFRFQPPASSVFVRVICGLLQNSG